MIFKLTPIKNSIRWRMWVKEGPTYAIWSNIGDPSSKTDIITLISYIERKRKW